MVGTQVDLGANADVLIVVPCLNEALHLGRLLAFLLRVADGAFIVVADGGSTDGSQKIVRQFAAEHDNLIALDNPGVIQSAGVNLAVRRYGEGRRWLLRVDAHALYQPDFIEKLRKAARVAQAHSVVVPMVTSGKGCFPKSVAAAQNSILGTGGAAHRRIAKGRWVEHGHHALMDLHLFMKAGGYDESFVTNEDAELDYRLTLMGAQIWLEPSAAITYFPRATAKGLFSQYRKYGSGRARNLERHRQAIKLRQFLPLGVVPAVIAGAIGIAFSPFYPVTAILLLPLLCWLFGVIVFGCMLGLRKRSLCEAGAGIAAILMHIGWSLGFFEEVFWCGPLPPAPLPLKFEEVLADRRSASLSN